MWSPRTTHCAVPLGLFMSQRLSTVSPLILYSCVMPRMCFLLLDFSTNSICFFDEILNLYRTGRYTKYVMCYNWWPISHLPHCNAYLMTCSVYNEAIVTRIFDYSSYEPLPSALPCNTLHILCAFYYILRTFRHFIRYMSERRDYW